MKIALITWHYDAYQGISRCVVELANRLSSCHEVHVFASAIDHNSEYRVQTHRIRLGLRRHYLAEWEFFLKAGLRLRRERFDLVHMHFPVWFPAHVFTSHGVAKSALRSLRRFPEEPRKDVSLRKMLPLYLQLPLYAYHLRNNQALITAVSEKVRNEIVHYYQRRPEEIPIIPNGVDLNQFHPSLVEQWREKMRTRLGIGQDRFMLLFVGNHLRHKGARYAIETLNRLPDNAILVIVGGDDVRNLSDHQNFLGPLMRSGRVIFAGLDPKIWRYYGAADALIFPSLYESFSLVVLEAMAAGLPVITSRTVALGNEAIQDGVNGFVVDWPWKIQEMVERVLVLMRDHKLAKSMGVKARKTAENYSWDSYVNRTQAVYDQILSR